MTNLESEGPRWIGSCNDELDMFSQFVDCSAKLLAYFAAPHCTAIVAISGVAREHDAFIVLHGCKRFSLPVSWKVRRLDSERKDSDTMLLSDAEHGVNIEFYAGRLCKRSDVINLYVDNLWLLQLIDDFNV